MADIMQLISPGRRRLAEYPRAIPLLVFALIVLATLLSVYLVERGEHREDKARLARNAQDISATLERRLLTGTAYLRAGAALCSSMPEITPEVFRRFVEDVRIDGDYLGTDGVGWAPLVKPGEVSMIEERLAAAYDRAITVYAAPNASPGRQTIVPVLFLEPQSARNRSALGFDMFSEPLRRAAMERADASKTSVATAPVMLAVRSAAPARGFIIYMPAYDETSPGGNLKGFIYSPYDANQLLQLAIPAEFPDNFGTSIYLSERSESGLLARYGPEPRPNSRLSQSFALAGETFIVEVGSSAPRGLSPVSLIILMLGLLIATLATLVVRLITRGAMADQQRLDWFEQQSSIRNSLTRELNHRVKNTLANVLSIIALTRRRASDIDEFAEGLSGRIRALSATHDLLTQSEWGATPIRAVVEAELAPYHRASENAISITGPDVELAPNDALSLGLALHELATNAAKYGALSTSGGEVHIRWEQLNNTLARLDWEECGGPEVATDRNRGFGTDLIERVIAHELRNPIDLEFAPSGVRCRLHVPIRQPSEFMMRANAIRAGQSDPLPN